MAIVNIGAGSGSEYGVYVGTVAPTDPSTTVWIVPDDEPTTIDDIAAQVAIKPTTNTTLSGVLKGANGKIAQAVAGTDYQAPLTAGTDYAQPSITVTVTLSATGWTDNAQTVVATGVTATNAVMIAPTPTSFLAYCDSQVRATAQAANALTFACEDVPTENLTVNILIMR